MLKYNNYRRRKGLWMVRASQTPWRWVTRPVVFCAAGILATFSSCVAIGQCTYEVTPIYASTCGGSFTLRQTIPTDISETSIVVGYHEQCDDSGNNEAFMWSAKTGFVELERPAQFRSIQAEGISPNGRYIVGWGFVPSAGKYYSVVWEEGAVTIIQPTGDSIAIEALAVNDARVIVGRMRDPSPKSDSYGPFRLVKGTIEFLTGPGSPDGQADAVNRDSAIAGHTGIPAYTSLGIVWLGSSSDPLNPLEADALSNAHSINFENIVAGSWNYPYDGEFDPVKPMIWRNGNAAELPRFPESVIGYGNDIADYGDVVGGMDGAPIWHDGQPYDLEDLIDDSRITHMNSARAINNKGEIAVVCGATIDGVSGVIGALLTPKGSGPGDLNRDCITNTNDLMLLIHEWNRSNSFADINQSGRVDVFDLFLLLANWG